MSSPWCGGADNTFVAGVNEDQFNPATDKVVSNASCTTNCFVPMVKVLDDTFGVTGIDDHDSTRTYTGDQSIVDGPHPTCSVGPMSGGDHHPHLNRCCSGHWPRTQAMNGKLDGTTSCARSQPA
ncbi:MAG: hypothetical protein R2706_19420 [Acidimicrobiales bacterium]